MHEECKECGLSFMQEPGYYFVAMYVSYAINVALMVTIWVGSLVLFDDDISIWWIVSASIILGLGLAPLTFRLSRLGWINFFIKYKPGLK